MVSTVARTCTPKREGGRQSTVALVADFRPPQSEISATFRRAPRQTHLFFTRNASCISGSMLQPKCWVYVLKSASDPTRYYTGVTSDWLMRIRSHNAGDPTHDQGSRCIEGYPRTTGRQAAVIPAAPSRSAFRLTQSQSAAFLPPSLYHQSGGLFRSPGVRIRRLVRSARSSRDHQWRMAGSARAREVRPSNPLYRDPAEITLLRVCQSLAI